MQKIGRISAFEMLFFILFNTEIFVISAVLKHCFLSYGYEYSIVGIFFYYEIVVFTLISNAIIIFCFFSGKSVLKEVFFVSILNFLSLIGLAISSIPFKL